MPDVVADFYGPVTFDWFDGEAEVIAAVRADVATFTAECPVSDPTQPDVDDRTPDAAAREYADGQSAALNYQGIHDAIEAAYLAGTAWMAGRAAEKIKDFRDWHQSEANREGGPLGDRLHAQLRANAARDILAAIERLATPPR